MENVEIEEYKNIIFDLDGVVFDSNIVKHQNIEIVINIIQTLKDITL